LTNVEKFCPSRQWGAIPDSEIWLKVRVIAAVLLTTALIYTAGCSRNQPVQRSESATAIKVPAAPLPPETNHLGEPLPTDPELPEGSGVVLWSKEFWGYLIAGFDGGLYEPYRPAAIQRVQKTLRDRGLYMGPMNGILDLPTMKSIYAFQKATDILQRCGIPTPYTRQMLEQGSHTDLSLN
jgi:hypothetical protein